MLPQIQIQQRQNTNQASLLYSNVVNSIVSGEVLVFRAPGAPQPGCAPLASASGCQSNKASSAGNLISAWRST